MIIGNGLIAHSCYSIDKDEILIFASGVSNSSELNNHQYLREKKLLLESIQQHPEKTIIYFSTCSIADPSLNNSRYVLHKLEMEDLIKKNAKKYLILRVGNVVGKGGNNNTLFNFFKNAIEKKDTINIFKKARRLLIDIEDIPKIIKIIDPETQNNSTINVAFPYQYSPLDIIQEISKHMNIKPDIVLEDKGSPYELQIEDIFFPFSSHPKNYLQNLIKKYV